MTYIDIINGVLRRLRESPVDSPAQTTYSRMVSDFVNDAKNIVQVAWDWEALRKDVTVTTVADTNTYTLEDVGAGYKMLSVTDTTNKRYLTYQPQTVIEKQLLNDSNVSGAPMWYTFKGVDTNGDPKVVLFPTPDASTTINFHVVSRQGDLVAGTDTLLIPSMPVLHYAVALLARERGETGGTSTQEYFEVATRYLSDAVAMDAGQHPDELQWYVP